MTGERSDLIGASMGFLWLFKRPPVLIAVVLVTAFLAASIPLVVQEAHQTAVKDAVYDEYGLTPPHGGVMPSTLNTTEPDVPLWTGDRKLRLCDVTVGSSRDEVDVTCRPPSN